MSTPSPQMRQLAERLWETRVRPEQPVQEHRAAFETMGQTFRVPEDVEVAPLTAAGVPCELVQAPGAREDRVCLYLHGGGYAIGGLATHREVAGRYSRALGGRVLLADYRLAPEHPCPAALEDAAAVYRSLLDEGTPPGQIALCGESAGGGLCMTLLTQLRRQGLPLPACAAVVSPWVDLTLGGESFASNRDSDPLVVPEVVAAYRDWFAAGRAAEDPLVSPVFAALEGLPPVFVTASLSEMLRDDAILLAQRLEQAGVEVSLELVAGAVHAWTLFPHLPESRETLDRIASFVRPRWGLPALPDAA
jgi:monoterpene epsilon-lactone hydrolase